MERSSSNVDDILSNYTYNNTTSYETSNLTPTKRPIRDSQGPFDTIPLPPLSRTTSQCSANSMASTAFLIEQHRHPSTAKATSGFHWPHPFHSRKDKYSGDSDFDMEKLSPVDDGGGGAGGGGRGGIIGSNEGGKQKMKPWEGWRLVLFGSCKFIPCLLRVMWSRTSFLSTGFNLLLVFLPASVSRTPIGPSFNADIPVNCN